MREPSGNKPAPTGAITMKNQTKTVRSVLAVATGLGAIAAASHGVDVLLQAAGWYARDGRPMSDGLFACAAVYRTLFGVLGCYLTARLAPDRPQRHALILGAIGTLLALLGAIATWNAGPQFGPHWYPLSLVLTAMPAALLAARLTRIPSTLVQTRA
jgi:peptidoglycan/LPS O-acetylase OafA/YrhL